MSKRIEYIFNFVSGMLALLFCIYTWSEINPIYLFLAMVGVFQISFLILFHVINISLKIILMFLEWLT